MLYPHERQGSENFDVPGHLTTQVFREAKSYLAAAATGTLDVRYVRRVSALLYKLTNMIVKGNLIVLK